MGALVVGAGWVALGIVTLLAIAILIRIFDGRIDLAALLSEKDGKNNVASMSRFQFLVFTFVIATSFIFIVASDKKFPDVPNGVLVLLGISGSSYLVSKGIQKAASNGIQDTGKAGGS